MSERAAPYVLDRPADNAARVRRPPRPEPLPDLTPDEVREVMHAAQLAKGGRAYQSVIFFRAGRLVVQPLAKMP